ncbi:hypothetical protein [Acidiphilium acidophilum]|nr:hypothetical protein [Acidiphilium acidophilum]
MKIFCRLRKHPALQRLAQFGLIYVISVTVFGLVILALQLLVPH